MKNKRTRDFFTINPELYKTFNDYINNNNLNKSKIIESLINDYMKNKI